MTCSGSRRRVDASGWPASTSSGRGRADRRNLARGGHRGPDGTDRQRGSRLRGVTCSWRIIAAGTESREQFSVGAHRPEGRKLPPRCAPRTRRSMIPGEGAGGRRHVVTRAGPGTVGGALREPAHPPAAAPAERTTPAGPGDRRDRPGRPAGRAGQTRARRRAPRPTRCPYHRPAGRAGQPDPGRPRRSGRPGGGRSPTAVGGDASAGPGRRAGIDAPTPYPAVGRGAAHQRPRGTVPGRRTAGRTCHRRSGRPAVRVRQVARPAGPGGAAAGSAPPRCTAAGGDHHLRRRDGAGGPRPAGHRVRRRGQDPVRRSAHQAARQGLAVPPAHRLRHRLRRLVQPVP